MAGLKVFVSSTCYDLSVIRSELRLFIQDIGHVPIMSDYNDILYDHRIHTHTSCLDEVTTCDAIIVIIGSRFGGESVPEAIAGIDFEQLLQESKSTKFLETKERISVTQLEVLKAIEVGIPLFAFIDQGVWHDHALYEKNKNKKIIDEITFPSIQKAETAKFIFEFINFLRHRTYGNSVFPFSRLHDIEDTLRSQWSQLFQKLLSEQRQRVQSAKRFDELTERFDQLQTAILSSIANKNDRVVARGIVRYKKLAAFVLDLNIPNFEILNFSDKFSFDDLLSQAGVVKTLIEGEFPSNLVSKKSDEKIKVVLLKEDESFFEMTVPEIVLDEVRRDWMAFQLLDHDIKTLIWTALSELIVLEGMLRYVPTLFSSFCNNAERMERVMARASLFAMNERKFQGEGLLGRFTDPDPVMIQIERPRRTVSSKPKKTKDK